MHSLVELHVLQEEGHSYIVVIDTSPFPLRIPACDVHELHVTEVLPSLVE